MIATPELRRIRRRMRADACWKAQHIFGFTPWSKQREILESVRQNPRTAVRSSHGTGKTATAARVVLDWMTEGRGIVVTTAPTWHQVEGQLWKEIATAARQAVIPIGGKLTSTRLEIAKDWVAYGLSTDQPERFQGEHSPRLLLVVDEASGVDEAIFQAAQGYLTAEGASVLLLGNPTRMAGTFFKAFQPDSRYHQIHISTFDTPAFTGEFVPPEVLRALPTREWEEEMRALYGDDAPEYLVRVKGEFASLSGVPYFKRLSTFEPVPAKLTGEIIGRPVKNGEVRFSSASSGPVKIWQEPRDDHFTIGADTAGSIIRDDYEARPRDAKLDAYCAYVENTRTGATAAVLHGRGWTEDEYALRLAQLGRLYNDAEIAVEKNGGYGVATIILLRQHYNYPNLYQHVDEDSIASHDETGAYGFPMTSTTRPIVLNDLAELLRESPEKLRDGDLKSEMQTFVWRGRTQNSGGMLRPEADVGAHDDRVLARAITRHVRNLRATRPLRVESEAQAASRAKLVKAQKARAVSPIARRAPKVGGQK